MNDKINIAFGGFALLIGIVSGVSINVFSIKHDVAAMRRLSSCQIEMQKAIPDPNDTEARSGFLKDNCN